MKTISYNFFNYKNGKEICYLSNIKFEKKYSDGCVDYVLEDDKVICFLPNKDSFEMYGKSGKYLKLVYNLKF